MSNEEIIKELQIIKQLLIAQLVLSGISIRDIVKITGISSASIYKFLPKNLDKKSG
ncbi:MAG: helix-turn-helix domain-containing protein [Nitrosotalea sp.]